MGRKGSDNKPKSCGSIYFNVKKGTPDSFRKKLNSLVKKLMKTEKVYLSISIAKKGGEGYNKFSAFFNTFKDSATKPDMFIRPTEVERVEEEDEDEDEDDIDIGGDDEDSDEEEAPKKKSKKSKPADDDDEDDDGDTEEDDEDDSIPF